MARYDFGGTLADFVVTSRRLGGLDVLGLSAATLTFWSAQTGGTRYTDLQLNGSTVSSVAVGTDGQVPKFQGPDGVTEMWADGGSPRVRVVTLQGAPGPVGPQGAASTVPGPTGPTGSQGPQGIPGVNAVANDTATAGQISTPGTATDTALKAAYTQLTSIATTATASATLAANRHTPVDATSAARTMTLPTTAAVGARLSVEKTDASTNAVNVTGTIRGTAAQTIALTAQYDARTFLSEGSGSWRPVSDHRTKASLDAAYAAAPSQSRSALTGWTHAGAYGAKGDGTTDDTTAIQAAIDACAANGGGMVFFPPGDYRVSSITIKDSVILWGGRLQFNYLAGGKFTARIRGNTSGAVVVDTPATGIGTCGVIGLDISGGTTAATCLRFQNVSWGVVKGVAFDNCQSTALSIGSSGTGFASAIEDVLITNAMLNRAPAALTGAVYVGSTDNYFNRVEVSTSETAISASGNVAAWQITGTNNFFSSCVGELSDLGWYCAGNANRYLGCRGDTNWGSDWNVVGGNNDFSGCKAMNSGKAALNTYDAWTVTGGGNTFSACSFYQPGSNTYRYGFNDGVNNSSVAFRTSYAACAGSGWATAMWATQGFLGSAPLIPNHPTRPSTGTTLDVSGSSLIVPNHASATTVTDFTGGAEGQEVKVIGNTNVTIANGTPIRTNTGANKTLVANVFYHFIRYNGVWYERA